MPKAQHRHVIGPKGANLRDVMQKTGVIVEVPPPDGDDETVILRGNQKQLVHALTMVYEKANSIKEVTFRIPAWLHKHCIGKSGSNMKKLHGDFPNVGGSF